jgi:subtilase family serine protease/flagellar hook assembly protein FlgD/fibronectin type 3 domain-containing protein
MAQSTARADEPRFERDEGNLAVIEHDGSSYDRTLPDGSLNTEPRERIVKEFLRTHGDFYDFIVIFTNFDFPRGDSTAFFLSVFNETEGIGLPTFDNRSRFGSTRIQGVIDMGPISQYREGALSVDPADPRFRATQGTLAHEVGHRWLSHVRYRDELGELRDDLLGRDESHWSFLLGSDASFLYGSRWRANGDGSYTAVEVESRFSELDLYLMGFLAPEEVSPLTLLVNPEVDRTRIPELGSRITATERMVRLDQVVAAEGARLPDYHASQKEFATAFVFLTQKDIVASESDLADVETIRRAFVTTFFGLTLGRGFVDTNLLEVTPPDPTAIPDTARALDWLLARQELDGRWEDDPRTTLRDTSVVVSSLEALGVPGEPLASGRAFLGAATPASVDGLSRVLPARTPSSPDALLALQNSDGGFGLALSYPSTALDTAMALEALTRMGAPAAARRKAATRLLALQRADGLWSSLGKGADLLATYHALEALGAVRDELSDLPIAASASRALATLVGRQNPDAGFGDSPSIPYATAWAVSVLLDFGGPAPVVDGALAYLRQTQRPDGSWNGSVFQTASVLEALVPASLPNLSIAASDVVPDPDPPEVGETVEIVVRIRNRGRVPAGAFFVQLFDGDPELGGAPVSEPVAVAGLAPGSTGVVSFGWDTTGLEGPHTLFAIADLEGALTEVSKLDNVATRSIDVLPPLPNLVLEELGLAPPSPADGRPATLAARVTNRGSVSSPASLLRVHFGAPAIGIVLDEENVPALAPGDSADFETIWDTTGERGTHRLHALVDPENALRERRENDNSRFVDVVVRPPLPLEPDLVVTTPDLVLEPSELTKLPQNVRLRAFVSNTGATDVAATRVALFQGNPAAGGIEIDSVFAASPGDSRVEVSFEFSVASGGTRAYFVVVDPDHAVAERDEGNNVASRTLLDRMDTVEVELVPSSISLSAGSLTAGETLTVSVDVRNGGTRRLASVPVALFFEDEPGGELVLASSANVGIDPGAVAHVTLSWKASRIGTISLTLRADPGNVLGEVDENNNEAAATVDVLASAEPNLVVRSTGIALAPETPLEGSPLRVSALVRNLGSVDAGPFAVTFFAGDPGAGGLPLGSASLPGIAASSEVTAEVEWTDVTLRGQQLFYVVVDSGSAVPEFDETDNVAFKVSRITGLPDLLASSAQVRLDPAFARAGDPVAIEASFTNAGEQDARSFDAAIRLDDPVAGDVLESVSGVDLPPGETFTLHASWDTTGLAGDHALFLVLDVSGAVREQREDNNVVRSPASVQDADLFVSPLYFSPNGDGVQDEAAFFFRAPSASTVSVSIVDSDQIPTRELLSGAGPNGSAVWDGRNDASVLVADGEYFFVLSSDAGEIARRRVVLDTNRSSLAEALGTPYTVSSDLSCKLPGGFRTNGPVWLPDDSAALFLVRLADPVAAPDYPRGLYRVSADGSVVDAIAQGPEFGDFVFHRHGGSTFPRAVSPDGKKVLLERTTFPSELRLFDLETGSSRVLATGGAHASFEGNRLLVAEPSGLYLYDENGERTMTLSSEPVAIAAWSPRGDRIAYRIEGEPRLRLIRPDGTEDVEIPESDVRDAALLGETTYEGVAVLDPLIWSRDARKLYFSWYNLGSNGEDSVGLLELTLETGALRLTSVSSFFEEARLSFDQRWYSDRPFPFELQVARRFDGREGRLLGTTDDLGSDVFWSYRGTAVTFQGKLAASPEGCAGPDSWAIRSLLNGAATLRVQPLPSKFGVRVTGTVADLNLDRYFLEFATLAAPESFTPVQSPSNVPVVGDVITSWLPPGPGDYLVRLRARDLAGNEIRRVERIFWNETLPISALRRSPEHISPNGDGVQDEAIFDYLVLEPVNLEFHVRDEEGRIVRTILRDEAAPGPASFAWDGNDGGGSRVPDGVYVMEVRGAELRVVVDSTPPDVAARHTNLYTAPRDPARASLVVDLDGHVRERNLVKWTVSGPMGEEVLSGLRQVGVSGSDELIYTSGAPLPGSEIRASDFAGNTTVVPISGPAREIRLVNEFEILKGFGTIFQRGIGPFGPGPTESPEEVKLPFFSPIKVVRIEGIPFPVPPTETVLGWTAQASFLNEGLVFRYRKAGEPAFLERPAPRGRFALAAKDLEPGARYEAHFASPGNEGVKSQDLDVVVGPDALFVSAERKPTRIEVRAFSTYDEELVDATLFMNRNGIVTPVRTYRPFPGDVTETIPIVVSCLDEITFYVIGRSASGVTRLSTTPRDYPDAKPAIVDLGPCGGVDDAQMQNQSSCEGSRPEEVLVNASGGNLPSAPTAIVLLAEGPTLALTEVARVANPPAVGPSASARLRWNVSALAEGLYTLRAEFHFAGLPSFVGENALQIYLDQSPPEAVVETPLEGGLACVRTIEGKEFVSLEAAGRDRLLKGLSIERVGGRPEERTGFFPEMPQPLEIRRSFLLPIETGFEGEMTLRLSVSGVRLPQETGGRPRSPTASNAPPFAGNNGSFLGCALRTVRVVRSEALGPLRVDGAFFSPNGDGRTDESFVRGDLLEAASVSARVVTLGGAPVRALATDVSMGTGPLTFAWDGRNDAGNVVNDGPYRIVIDAVTACGALSTRSVSVELDNTAPVASIASPTPGQIVSVTVPVSGSAFDKNFLGYVLESGLTPIGEPGRSQVRDRALGVWDVGELEGLQTLRLTVEDKAGNVESDEIVVDVRSPEPIEKLEADPAIFSPNGDGIRDRSEIRFRLKRESLVTLEIKGGSGDVVRKPFDSALLPAGDHSFEWDGTGPSGDAPDGAYVAVVLAIDSTLPALSEEASVALIADRVPPALRIDNLAEGAFLALPLELMGEATDPRFENYQLEVGPPSTVLTTGSEPVTGVLGRLADLPDGPYQLRLTASDLAGNTAELSLAFTADAKLPALSLTVPEEGAVLPRSSVPVPVRGSVSETNLESYLLEFGLGVPPRTLVPLSGGASPGEVSADWAVAEFPDGRYTLKLSARDRAANRGELLRQVTLDGTPPTVAIDAPSEGFVTSQAPFRGTAFDENFESASLEIAPGPIETAFQFTEVAPLASAIQGGELHPGLALEDGEYTLRLTAVDRAGNEASVSRGFTFDKTPPGAPSGLAASVENREDVRLRWTPNGEPDLAGYLVFRGTVQLNQEPLAATELLDSGRPEGVWVYTLRAVDLAGLVSEPSAPADARIDLTPPRAALVAPENGGAIRGLVDVIGTAFAESDFKEYRLTFARVESPATPTLLRRSSVPESFATLVQWDATLLDGSFLLRLEAEDTSGNVAAAESRVVVDNRAPAAPLLESVTAPLEPDDVEVVWQEVSEPDVAGYLVFRNGQLANAPGPVSGDLRPFLVTGSSYVDLDRPDGTFCYRVAAMDRAGNLSADSNEICIELDNRAPAAVLFDPVDGERFDQSRQVRAFVVDEDVLTVRFEYQPEGAPSWTEMGTDPAPPFETLWDVAGLAFGTYRLRAIATDRTFQSDPAPQSIGVEITDVTPPPIPTGLTAQVTGRDVRLSWNGVGASDLGGYRLYRDGIAIATLPSTATTYDDTSRPDGVFRYEVTSVDTDANESGKSEPRSARVYAPSLAPLFPIYPNDTTDVPGSGVEPGAAVALRAAGTLDILQEVVADSAGAFVFDDLLLPEGVHLLEATATDPSGNVSRVSDVLYLLRDSRPARPADFDGVSSGESATLSWRANVEPDLSGYSVRRDGNALVPEQRISRTGPFATALTATASSVSSPNVPDRAIDGTTSTRWASASRTPFEPQWLQIEMNPPRHLRQLRINFSAPASRDYQILAELRGVWIPLVTVRGNALFQVVHRFPIAPRTSRIQIRVTALTSAGGSATVSEVELTGEFPGSATSATDTPGARGTYDYTVAAVDDLGLESEPAGPLPVDIGDVVPPDAPTNLTATPSGPDVDLAWTGNPLDDALYRLYRDSAFLAEVAGTTYRDPGLPNGSYTYRVTALDAAGNEGPPSNDATADVEVPPPDAPVDLVVFEVPSGRALDLSWRASNGPFGVAGYVVFRSGASGGPYEEAGATDQIFFRDRDLENGTEYFYVVRARDPFGNVSLDSNEASGIPRDTEPPSPPRIVYPTGAGSPITLFAPATDVAGTTEPGASIELTKNGAPAGTALAEATTREERRVSLGFGDVSDEISALSPAFPTVALARATEVRLYDLVTGIQRAVALPPGLVPAYRGIAFSSDGKKLALALRDDGTFEEKLLILDVDSGAAEELVLNDEAGWPAFLSATEVAVGEGNQILAIDLASGDRRALYQAAVFFDRPERLLPSRDGLYLAFFESFSGRIQLLSLTTSAVETISAESERKGYVFTGDGDLAFTDGAGLSLYDPDTGSTARVPETEESFWPRSLSDGRLSVLRDPGSALELHLFDGTTVEPAGVLSFDRFATGLLDWSNDARLAIHDGSGLAVLLPAGRFEIPRLALEPGTNALVATAGDESGNVGPPSDAVEVTFDPSRLPDLAPSGEVLVVPIVPTSGQRAVLSLAIENRGGRPSAPALVRATGSDVSGTLYTIGSTTTPALAPGARASVSLSWETAGLVGAQFLVVEIDPLRVLDESDDRNNVASRSTTVVVDGGLSLSVATGLPSYGANQDVEIAVVAVNGGVDRRMTFETLVETETGLLVAPVDVRSLSLAYGASSEYAVFWNTGATLGGAYRARVNALDGDAIVATATAELSVRRSVSLEATVLTDRPSYPEGRPVEILGRIAHRGGNSALRNLAARIRVTDELGTVVFEDARTVSYLAIGGNVALSATWTSLGAPAGAYRAALDVIEDSNVAASSLSPFRIEPATELALSGTLALAAREVPIGSDVVARFEVRNSGALALASGIVRVDVLDPTGIPLLSRETGADVSSGGTLTGELLLPSASLGLSDHTVRLSAGAPAAPRALDFRLVRIFGVPVPPSLNAPAEGESTASPVSLSVNNGASPNGELLTYEFEIYLDDALRFQLASASGVPEGAAATTWKVPVVLEENRSFYFRARARDRFAVSAWMPPASFVVDSRNDPPGSPILSAPAESTRVAELSPTLEVGNALDPEGAPLIYTFEVATDAERADVIATIGGVIEGAGTTSAGVPIALEEDRTYYWSARATDGELDSEWMATASFRVDTGNHPPRAPEPIAPIGRSSSPTPELVTSLAVDPEGDPVSYSFEIDRNPSFSSPEIQRADGVFGGPSDVRFRVPAALTENALYHWRARGSDGLATGEWSRVESFRVDQGNEPPAAPRLQSPTGGTLVSTRTPPLVVVNAADPEEDTLTYDFEVYRDRNLLDLVATISRIREGENVTAWSVSPRLDEDVEYYWRARARDSQQAGSWSLSESFRVNAMNGAPSAPSPESPPDGALVATVPALTVRNAVDPDLDSLTYRFELYRDEMLQHLVAASDEIPEDAGTTSWQLPVALQENALYYWRARARDPELEGSFTPTARFRFSEQNEPPGPPAPLSPSDGGESDTKTPTLVVSNAVDPEGDSLRYVFEIAESDDFLTGLRTSPPQDEGTGETSWQVALELSENVTYFWRTHATDGLAAGPPSDVRSFRVNAHHDPPSVPVPIAPPDGAELPSPLVELVVQNGESPDGYALRYHFVVASDAAFQNVLREDGNVPEGIGETAWSVSLDPGSTYFWKVRAIDEGGVASDFGSVLQFRILLGTECPPVWSEDFESHAPGTEPEGFWLRKLSGSPFFSVSWAPGNQYLGSTASGEGALIFLGSGESASWRNYSFEGALSLGEDDDDDSSDDDSDDDDGCAFDTGVVFYSDATFSSHYRLELGEDCEAARLVKVAAGVVSVLALAPAPFELEDDEPVRFRIEVFSDASETVIRVHLTAPDDDGDERELWLDASDGTAPLRAGTVGVYRRGSGARWDDFVVEALPGHESGISGDEDRDGVCDADQTCPAAETLCLDEGYQSKTGLSNWVVGRSGNTGHSGPTACGAKNSYYVQKKTGVLQVATPPLGGGTYEFQILLQRGTSGQSAPNLRIVFGSGKAFDFSDPKSPAEGPFLWTSPVGVTLPPATSGFQIRSIGNPPVHVEAVRLKQVCEP